ncbi:putative holin-like toxin [Brevibacillus fulvus]|nr:putative holin-like toxin [Brevibacillus fulvus]
MFGMFILALLTYLKQK